jgi:spermidine synthase
VTEAARLARPSAATGVLYAAFGLSGSAALVYQVLWTRQLGLVFGVTVHAASTVLACFMAGLAIGSAVAGKRSDSLRNPVRAFATVELVIGLCGLVTPLILPAVTAVFDSVAPELPSHIVLLTILRLTLACVVVLLPAALMGATYPLILSALADTAGGLRRNASLLYGINTAGAIGGVLVGSLWLVPTLGIRQSFLVAAAANFLVCATAWIAAPHVRSWFRQAARRAAPF